MKFKDIPKFPSVRYEVDVPWDLLERKISEETSELNLNLEPDFQRAHVWTKAQQIAYVEYQLRGGEVAKNITFNFPGFQDGWKGEYVIVDGKQRLEAVRAFLRSDIKVFGHFYKDYEDSLSMLCTVKWRICTLQTKAETLQLYLNINAGGTPHTKEELDKVKKMLEKEQKSNV